MFDRFNIRGLPTYPHTHESQSSDQKRALARSSTSASVSKKPLDSATSPATCSSRRSISENLLWFGLVLVCGVKMCRNDGCNSNMLHTYHHHPRPAPTTRARAHNQTVKSSGGPTSPVNRKPNQAYIYIHVYLYMRHISKQINARTHRTSCTESRRPLMALRSAVSVQSLR